jgi:hypothetical protein
VSAKRTRPRAVPGVGQGLGVPQIGAHGLSVASVSLVADDSRHSLEPVDDEYVDDDYIPEHGWMGRP